MNEAGLRGALRSAFQLKPGALPVHHGSALDGAHRLGAQSRLGRVGLAMTAAVHVGILIVRGPPGWGGDLRPAVGVRLLRGEA